VKLGIHFTLIFATRLFVVLHDASPSVITIKLLVYI
jgi:hypothetical protein